MRIAALGLIAALLLPAALLVRPAAACCCAAAAGAHCPMKRAASKCDTTCSMRGSEPTAVVAVPSLGARQPAMIRGAAEEIVPAATAAYARLDVRVASRAARPPDAPPPKRA